MYSGGFRKLVVVFLDGGIGADPQVGERLR